MIFLFAAFLNIFSSTAFAVDEAPVIAEEKDNEYFLVGVIRESSAAKNVALIKNKKSGKSFALKVGDALPWQKEHFVLEIDKAEVVVGDNQTKSKIYTDTFVASATSSESSSDSADADSDIDELNWREILEGHDESEYDQLNTLLENLSDEKKAAPTSSVPAADSI